MIDRSNISEDNSKQCDSKSATDDLGQSSRGVPRRKRSNNRKSNIEQRANKARNIMSKESPKKWKK